MAFTSKVRNRPILCSTGTVEASYTRSCRWITTRTQFYSTASFVPSAGSPQGTVNYISPLDSTEISTRAPLLPLDHHQEKHAVLPWTNSTSTRSPLVRHRSYRRLTQVAPRRMFYLLARRSPFSWGMSYSGQLTV